MLERVTACLGVEEIHSEEHDDEHNDEDKVVLPSNALKRNGVDESVENDRDNNSNPCDRKTVGT